MGYISSIWGEAPVNRCTAKLCSRWRRRRNHVCQVSKWNFQGLRFYRGRSFHFPIDFWMSLTTVAYCAACDCTFNDILITAGNTSCTTNVSAVRENDIIVMKCSVTYSGNWAPDMRWFNSSHNFTDDDITLTTSDTTVTSQLTFQASIGLQGSQIICVTYFAQPRKPLSTNATNIPSYSYKWTSPTLNVHCKRTRVVMSVNSRRRFWIK